MVNAHLLPALIAWGNETIGEPRIDLVLADVDVERLVGQPFSVFSDKDFKGHGAVVATLCDHSPPFLWAETENSPSGPEDLVSGDENAFILFNQGKIQWSDVDRNCNLFIIRKYLNFFRQWFSIGGPAGT